ncbi:transposase [Streptomyces sp. NPDC059262]|uniref:transposase n=1 Tax=Streptomyces sp. NPDC059262 TaxID=3346797 RepID=UPI0036AC2BCE
MIIGLDRSAGVPAALADFEAELKQFNGEEDHVHLLVHYPPKVRLLQASASGVRRAHPPLPVGSHFWSGSYFAGSCDGT